MKQLGVLVPIVTPCSRTGVPDLEGLASVCRYVLGAGCHGIFVAGSTGRGPWFGREERAEICRTVSKLIQPKTLLFAGCIASGLADMLENARLMADAGAGIAVLTSPTYYNYSQKELEAIFLAFADSSPIPVMIYDIPAFTGSKLDTGMVSRLAGHRNICGFKDSSADLERFKTLLGNLSHLEDFYLLQGKEHLLAASLQGGASGLVVSLLHIGCRPFVGLYDAVRSANGKLTDLLQDAITRVMELVGESFKRRPETSTLFHILNRALRKRGVCENILLGHEGECPDWLEGQADRAMAILDEAEKHLAS